MRKVIIIAIVNFAHCATLLSPKTYPVYIAVNQESANVTFSCDKEKIIHSKSPAVYFQSPSEKCKIIIEKENYGTIELETKKRINPMFYSSLLFSVFMFVPPIVDLISGHWRRPDSGIIEVELKKIPEEGKKGKSENRLPKK